MYAEDLFSVVPGLEISAELYKPRAVAICAIRERMGIGYHTLLTRVGLAGYDIDGHWRSRRQQLPEDKRNIKRNDVYPCFTSAVESFVKWYFQTDGQNRNCSECTLMPVSVALKADLPSPRIIFVM